MSRLESKVAIVTGGSRGIGKTVVEKLIADGAKKVYSLDLKKGEYDIPNVEQIEVSVTDRAGLAAAIEKIKNESGKVDILVNNAGITKDSLLERLDESAWDAVIDVNLKGVYNITQLVAPIMMENGSGSIINIASIAGVYGNIGQTNYSATKAGVIGMAKTWSKEFTRKGAQIRTNVIVPGFIATEMGMAVPEKMIAMAKAATPLGRLGQPEDIANAIAFLASDESSFINGSVLEVTGGLKL